MGEPARKIEQASRPCPELVAHRRRRRRRLRHQGVYWAFIFATHFVSVRGGGE